MGSKKGRGSRASKSDTSKDLIEKKPCVCFNDSSYKNGNYKAVLFICFECSEELAASAAPKKEKTK